MYGKSAVIRGDDVVPKRTFSLAFRQTPTSRNAQMGNEWVYGMQRCHHIVSGRAGRKPLDGLGGKDEASDGAPAAQKIVRSDAFAHRSATRRRSILVRKA